MTPIPAVAWAGRTGSPLVKALRGEQEAIELTSVQPSMLRWVLLLVVSNPAKPGRSASTPGRDHMVYHMVVGRKEVLVQLDDDLIDRLDRLADKQGTSRSELLRRGAAAVLEAAEHAEADRALQDAYRRMPQDRAIVAAASRLAALTAPGW